jgi:tetratricopeptide (TPR) repeat protein
MKNQSEDFASLLGYYRTRAGLTQEKLGRKIGVHRNTIDKWERRIIIRLQSRGQVLRLADELILSKEERKVLIQAAGFPIKQWPTEVWTVPLLRDMFFTGRDDVFQSLRQLLLPGSTTALTQAISGLGGIGKTAVAVEYAYRYSQYYEAVLWLQADSWEVLTSECIKLAAELELPEHKETDQIIVEVQHWLRKHRHWLLILDNMTSPQEILPKFVPTDHRGSVLVTTRMHSVEPLAQTQVLTTMSEQEGILFLLRRTQKIAAKAGLEKVSSEQYNEAKQIWELMDGLPLALDQAGAYILETDCSFSAYREQYIHRNAELLQRRGMLTIGHEMSVATTFSLAFEQVKSLSPAAADILCICSLLYSEAIPEELFWEGAKYLGSHLADERNDKHLAIAVLLQYSLIQRNTDVRTLTIHRLVQAVLQDLLPDEEYSEWIGRATAVLSRIFPEVEFTTWSQCERYLPHVLACMSAIEQRELPLIHYALSLFYRAGQYLYERGQYSDAVPLCERALIALELVLELEDLRMVTPLTILAVLYKSLGKYEQAEPLYQRALAIREQQLGIEHVNVAASLTNLGELYHTQKKYEQAEPLYQRALVIAERQVAVRQFGVSAILHNLASLYGDQEKYEQAEPLYQRALALREQQLGAEHPETARTLNNLASLYEAQGKYEQAEPLYQRALVIREQQLGAEHPNTADTLNHLATLYQAQKKYEQAEFLHKKAFVILQQTLGIEHPNTVDTLDHLALLSIDQGKYEQAESLFQEAFTTQQKQAPEIGYSYVARSLSRLASLYEEVRRYEQAVRLYERILAIREQWLVAEHLETTETLERLARLYSVLGKYEQAEQLYQRSLAIREQQLGVQHPKTIITLNNLAMLYYHQEKYEQAELLFTRALVSGEGVLEDEDIAAVRVNLAAFYTKQEKYEQAEPLWQQAITLLQRTLGIEHSLTTGCLNTLENLYRKQGKDKQIEILYLDILAPSFDNQAHRYFSQGKYEQAEPLFKQALAIREQRLGVDHPDTATALDNLALLYYTQGKYGQAEPLFKQALAIREQRLGVDHPDTAESLNSLASLYLIQEKYEQAEPLFKQALAIREQRLGVDHSDTARSLNHLAALYNDQGKYEQAEPLYTRALAIQEKLESGDRGTVTTLNNLASFYRERGRYEQAMSLYQRALAIQKQRLGTELPHIVATLDTHAILDTATILDNLALLYDDVGAYGEAEQLYQQSLSIYEQRLGSEHPDTVIALNNLALFYQEQGKYKQAELLYRRLLSIRELTLGQQHPKTVKTRKSYATLLEKVRQQGKAAFLESSQPKQEMKEEERNVHREE